MCYTNTYRLELKQSQAGKKRKAKNTPLSLFSTTHACKDRQRMTL
nr:MAG TPA: hypothetical protein [Caudoviricetes sp.]